MGRMACPHGMGTVYRRRDSYCPWVLQDSSRMDNGAVAGG